VSVFVVAAVAAWFAVVVVAACALPSRPRVRKLPLSKVTAATLTCAKRMRIACLRRSSRLPSASFVVRRRLGDGWALLLISANELHMHHPSS
jgi:hypothetical protein